MAVATKMRVKERFVPYNNYTSTSEAIILMNVLLTYPFKTMILFFLVNDDFCCCLKNIAFRKVYTNEIQRNAN